MATFTSEVSVGQIVSEIWNDEDELAELIALIANRTLRLSDDDAIFLGDCIYSHAEADGLRRLAALLLKIAEDKEA